MTNPEIEKLITKYFTNTATLDELKTLALWIEETANEQEFFLYIKANYAADHHLQHFNTSRAKNRILEIIQEEKKTHTLNRFRNFMKYAAVVILFLGTAYFFQQQFFPIQHEKLIIPDKSIVLQLANGDIKILDEKGSLQIMDDRGKVIGKQKGPQLSYYGETDTDTLVYNELAVPYGKQFKLQLSDGTRVILNSGSFIKYPVNFIKDFNRKVFLSGEAWFEVTENHSRPFIVNAQKLNVRVLGTCFNVAAYSEDPETDVVLVKGSVSLYVDEHDFLSKKDIVLKPGNMGVFKRSNQEITTKQVNTTIYTSWIDGNVVFRNATFSNIVTKLERYYNVDIINNNQKLAIETFNASIDIQTEPIEKVLNYFKRVYHIEYKIKDNKIIIN